MKPTEPLQSVRVTAGSGVSLLSADDAQSLADTNEGIDSTVDIIQ